jgi:hypothetical protein
MMWMLFTQSCVVLNVLYRAGGTCWVTDSATQFFTLYSRLHRQYHSRSLQTVLTLTVLTVALPCRFSCTALIPVLPCTALSYSKAGCSSLVNSLPFFPGSLCRSDYSRRILHLCLSLTLEMSNSRLSL